MLEPSSYKEPGLRCAKPDRPGVREDGRTHARLAPGDDPPDSIAAIRGVVVAASAPVRLPRRCATPGAGGPQCGSSAVRVVAQRRASVRRVCSRRRERFSWLSAGQRGASPSVTSRRAVGAGILALGAGRRVLRRHGGPARPGPDRAQPRALVCEPHPHGVSPGARGLPARVRAFSLRLWSENAAGPIRPIWRGTRPDCFRTCRIRS